MNRQTTFYLARSRLGDNQVAHPPNAIHVVAVDDDDVVGNVVVIDES
jgi:hypothetical protein